MCAVTVGLWDIFLMDKLQITLGNAVDSGNNIGGVLLSMTVNGTHLRRSRKMSLHHLPMSKKFQAMQSELE